jgi:hypothetical protein
MRPYDQETMMDQNQTMTGVCWLYDASNSLELGVVLKPCALVGLGLVPAWQVTGLVGDACVELDAWGWQLRDGTGYKVELLWEQVVVLLDRLPAAQRERGKELERARWSARAGAGSTPHGAAAAPCGGQQPACSRPAKKRRARAASQCVEGRSSLSRGYQ